MALNSIKNGSNEILNLQVIGDSITEGYYGGSTKNDIITKGYVGNLRTYFKTMFEDVGLGIIPSWYPSYESLWTFAGTWADSVIGITRRSKYTATINSTATLSFNGTGIGVLFAKGATSGECDIMVDGNVVDSLDLYSATLNTAYMYTKTGLTSGDHTLVVKKTDNTSELVVLQGAYEIKGARGVRVNMCGYSGEGIYNNKIQDEYSLKSSIDVWNPALTIISIFTNDHGHNTTPSAYQTGLQTIISRAKQFGDVLLTSISPDARTYTYTLDQYNTVLKNLASINNCGFLDLYRLAHESEAWLENMGYIYSTDNLHVHPNGVGHQFIADAILKAIA